MSDRPHPASGPALSPLPRDRFGRFVGGFSAPWRGGRLLLANPRLWPLAGVPVLLTGVLFGLALWAAIRFAPALVDLLWEQPAGGWGQALWYSAALVAGLLLAGTGLVLTYASAGLIATPFNDLLSERLVELLLGPQPEPTGWRQWLRDTALSLGHSLLNLTTWAVIMVPLTLGGLLPGIGLVFAAAGLVATALFLARDLLDGPLTRRRLSYRQKVRLVRQELAAAGGLGAGAMLLMWLPGLNLLLLPVAVAGGAVLFCRLEREGRIPAGALSPPAESGRCAPAAPAR